MYPQSQGRDNNKSAGDGDEEEHGEDYSNEGDEAENETSGQCRYECSGWPNKKCKVRVIFKVIFSTIYSSDPVFENLSPQTQGRYGWASCLAPFKRGITVSNYPK